MHQDIYFIISIIIIKYIQFNILLFSNPMNFQSRKTMIFASSYLFGGLTYFIRKSHDDGVAAFQIYKNKEKLTFQDHYQYHIYQQQNEYDAIKYGVMEFGNIILRGGNSIIWPIPVFLEMIVFGVYKIHKIENDNNKNY